jgi:hypothetical protein
MRVVLRASVRDTDARKATVRRFGKIRPTRAKVRIPDEEIGTSPPH